MWPETDLVILRFWRQQDGREKIQGHMPGMWQRTLDLQKCCYANRLECRYWDLMEVEKYVERQNGDESE